MTGMDRVLARYRARGHGGHFGPLLVWTLIGATATAGGVVGVVAAIVGGRVLRHHRARRAAS